MSVAYNIYAYLKANLPGVTFIVNGGSEEDTNNNILIMSSTGTSNTKGLKTDENVQIYARNKSSMTAGKQLQTIYKLMANRYSLVLPALIGDGGDILYPALTAASIQAIQIPSYMGVNKNGLHRWSFNLYIIY